MFDLIKFRRSWNRLLFPRYACVQDSYLMAYSISTSWRLSPRSLIPGTEGERVDCSACKWTREQESGDVCHGERHQMTWESSTCLQNTEPGPLSSHSKWEGLNRHLRYNMVQYTLHTDCRNNVWGPTQFMWKSCVVVGLPMSTTWTDSCFFLETWPGATFAREWTNYITCLTTGTIDNDPRKSSSYHPSWKSEIFAEILRYLTLDVINKGVFLRIRPQEDTY